MTIWQFAIARRHAQLLEASAQRTLTESEGENLERTGQWVEAYEGQKSRLVEVESGGAN